MEHVEHFRECSHLSDDRIFHKIIFVQSQVMGAYRSAFVAIAMAHAGASKRCLVDIDDRRRLGHWNKRLRTNAETSKVTLDTSAARMLIDIEQVIISMDDRFEAIRQHRDFVQDAVDECRFIPAASFCIGHLHELCMAGRHTVHDLQADMATSCAFRDLELLATQHVSMVVPVHSDEANALARRIAYFRDCALVLPEVHELLCTEDVGLIEDSNDEVRAASYADAFSRAETAVQDVLDITNDKPLTDIDIGQYTHVLTNRTLLLRESVQTTLPMILTFYDDILQNEYSKYVRKIRCMVCFDEVVEATKCSAACDGGMCVDCFVHRMQSCTSTDLMTTSAVVNVLCISCQAPLDKRLLQLMPPFAMDMYIKVVADFAAASANMCRIETERTKKRTRRAAQRSDNLSFKEKLYNLERQVTNPRDEKTKLVASHCDFYILGL